MKVNVYDANSWLYPDSTGGKSEVSLHVAKNTYARAQLLLEFEQEGEEVFLVSEGDLNVDFYELLPVCVNRNSDFIEERDYAHTPLGEMPQYYTKTAPFDVCDPILPLENGKIVSAKRKAVYVKIHIPADTKSGVYDGKIDIKCGDEIVAVPYHIMVGNAVVERTDNFKLTHWIEITEGGYQCKPLSDRWWEVLYEMVRIAHEAGQNMIMPPVSLISYDGEHFGFEQLDCFLKKCFGIGIRYIEGPHLSGVFNTFYPGTDRDFETSKDTVEFCKKFMCDWYAYLSQNGYAGITYQHIFDEPREVNAELYATLCSLAKECMPGVATMDAILTKEITTLPDVLVPTTRFYQLCKESFDEMLGDSHKLWLYTCCWPSAPYLNRFMDMPLLWTRLIFWLCKKMKAEGYLHWALAYVADGQDPYQAPAQPFKIFSDSAEQFLPPGDMYIVYPYEGRPIGSARLEMVSAAMDDIALLDALDDVDAQNLLSACLTENWTAAVDAEAFNELHKKLCMRQ